MLGSANCNIQKQKLQEKRKKIKPIFNISYLEAFGMVQIMKSGTPLQFI
jgi:hypothetical protein